MTQRLARGWFFLRLTTYRFVNFSKRITLMLRHSIPFQLCAAPLFFSRRFRSRHFVPSSGDAPATPNWRRLNRRFARSKNLRKKFIPARAQSLRCLKVTRDGLLVSSTAFWKELVQGDGLRGL